MNYRSWMNGLGLLLLTVILFFVAYKLFPGFFRSAWRLKAVTAGVGAVLVIGFAILHRRIEGFGPHMMWKETGRTALVARAFYFLMILSIVSAAVAYYRFDLRNLTRQRNYDDVTYYYLNSKYFSELGYTQFYIALIAADAEEKVMFKDIPKFRDLETYEMVPRQTALERAGEMKRRFSPERWDEFKQDLVAIQGLWPAGDWRYLLADHGYNPPPTWTLIGGALSGWCPVTSMKWITAVDIVLVSAMFAAVFWAFGLDALLFSLLFFFTTLSGIWPLVGQALLRFDWLAAVVCGLAFAARKKPLWAGACLAYAALIRVFPGAVAIPFVVAIVHELVTTKRLTDFNRRVLLGAVLTTVMLVGGATAVLGPGAFEEASRKIALHAGPESFSSQRVGLGDALVFHGETTRLEMDVRGGTFAKAEQIKDRSLFLYGIALTALVSLLVLQLRDRREPYLVAPLYVVLIYILTTPQINYFNIRLLLVIWAVLTMVRSRRLVFGAMVLVSMFITEVVAQYCDAHYVRYCATSATSLGMSVTFSFIWVGEARSIFSGWGDTTHWLRRRFLPEALMLGMLMSAAGYATAYRVFEEARREPIRKSRVEMKQVQRAGARWDGEGAVVLDKRGVAVDLGGRVHAPRIGLSVDGNDSYRLELYLENRPVALYPVQPPGNGAGGLQLETIDLPGEIAATGYDTAKVVPERGDGYYSLGHLVLIDK